ncbi:MAG TPA: ATP-binding protein [Chloroflexota bacterium]|nr:ATP-binding protein [Chloroflexota bacterium]
MSGSGWRAPLSPAQFDAILQSAADGVTVQDRSGRLVYANDTAARMSGYESAAAMVAAGPLDVSSFRILDVAGNMLAPEQLPVQRALRGEEPAVAIIRYRTAPEAEERWSDVRSTAIRDEAGNVALAVTIFRDITEERRISEERSFLAAAGPLLAGSLDYDVTLARLAELAVPRIADWCAIQMIETDGSVRTLAVAHVDPAKVRLAQDMSDAVPFDPDGPTGLPRVLRTGEPDLIPEITDEMLVEGSPNEWVLERLRELGLKSSMVVPLTARGRVLGAISMVSAESGRRFGARDLDLALDLASRAAIAVDNAHLYQEAARSARQLTQVLRQMLDAVMIVDADGRLILANEAATNLMGEIETGVRFEEARPHMAAMTLKGELLSPDALPLARASRGARVTGELWKIRRAGAEGDLVVQSNAVPLTDEDGTHLGAVAVTRDITAAYQLERMKEEFFLAASHDLKNPLTLVRGVAQMLLRRAEARSPDLETQLRDGLRRIDATAKRMTHMINELLDVSRMQTGQPLPLEPRTTDLLALTREAVADQQAVVEEGQIQLSADSETIVGEWDPGRLERVVANLLSNAVKFSPPGAPIRVQLESETVQGNRWVNLAIRDNGVGIPASDLPHVFEHFRRANNVTGRIAGTGLGLAGAKQIVEQHGGEITVTSQENQGSTFVIRLPVHTSDGGGTR